jgi:hypothetical protein
MGSATSRVLKICLLVAEEETPSSSCQASLSLRAVSFLLAGEAARSATPEDGGPVLIPKETESCACDTLELCQVCQSFQVCAFRQRSVVYVFGSDPAIFFIGGSGFFGDHGRYTVLRILDVYLGSRIFCIPDPNFSHPRSLIRINEFKVPYFNPKNCF